ncbi:hypothetical protein LTR82_015140 [Friedmanniomyces endolithicus]|uniref:Cytochrome P450 n=1 Tax=Friedmanniomyces endolithicus TaxID=329885 RepID=A0AAN6F8U4_9PEZI|nr:hypothetical protein LTR82_015140 [Friedmanniomyces endolithicus]
MLSTSDFADRFHRYSSSLVFCLAYGRRLTRGDEDEAKSIDRVMESFTYAARVGTWIVDALPFLNYLPPFVAPRKRYGAKLHAFEADLYQKNLDSAEKSLSWNWAKQVRSMKEIQGMSDLEIAYDVGIIYEAGSDTTKMAMEVFVMAAVLFPSVVAKAQRELDSVVGKNRLPTFEDRDDLPYIQAVVKEVLRWRPVSAGGIPHATTQEDQYMGYGIPKGATVIGNHWSIHLDEELYQHPYSFEPMRWIENPDLPLHAFGFGRRVCTGQHIAKNSLFINVSRLLWGFDIEYVYEECNAYKVRCEIDPFSMTQGFNSRPMPFKASFSVRSAKVEDVITTSWAEAEKDADVLLKKIRQEQGKPNA